MNMKQYFLLISFICLFINILYAQSNSKQLRICYWGSSDDCDVKAGGTAALFAAMGHAVKFVSVTNGDAGHHLVGGGFAKRGRRSTEAGKRPGAVYDVLDNHDGELLHHWK
jgi:hypothetical protein